MLHIHVWCLYEVFDVRCSVGTNLQSLLDHTQSKEVSASVVLVISNVAGVAGLDRAKKANVNTLVPTLLIDINISRCFHFGRLQNSVLLINIVILQAVFQ